MKKEKEKKKKENQDEITQLLRSLKWMSLSLSGRSAFTGRFLPALQYYEFFFFLQTLLHFYLTSSLLFLDSLSFLINLPIFKYGLPPCWTWWLLQLYVLFLQLESIQFKSVNTSYCTGKLVWHSNWRLSGDFDCAT